MAPNILVVGSFMMDLIVRTDRIPKEGETVVGTEFQRAPGGKGANQAMAAARAGGSVTMVGRVGDDLFGQDQIDSLKGQGINTDYIIKDKEAPTGVGSITLWGSNNRIIIVPGANMRCTTEDVERAEEALKAADVILLQLEIPLEVNRYVLEKAKQLGKKVVFNPAPASELDDYIFQNVTVFTPNETEAESFSGVPVKSIDDAKRAAEVLLSKGVETVVMTLGENGSLLATKDETLHVPSRRVDVVDTTAAGDAFNGALAVGIAKGLPWKEALTFANATGALTTTKMGAQPAIPTLAEIEAFMEG